MRPLWAVADFVRALRRQRQHGEISRAPLKLQRVEFRTDTVECDWVARPVDAWDSNLRRGVRERNESEQVLLDAIAMRHLVFDAFRDIDCAVLRAFRQPARELPELILLGTVSREMPEVDRVTSLAMRARLYGFCFALEDGFLKAMHAGETSEEFIS